MIWPMKSWTPWFVTIQFTICFVCWYTVHLVLSMIIFVFSYRYFRIYVSLCLIFHVLIITVNFIYSFELTQVEQGYLALAKKNLYLHPFASATCVLNFLLVMHFINFPAGYLKLTLMKQKHFIQNYFPCRNKANWV